MKNRIIKFRAWDTKEKKWAEYHQFGSMTEKGKGFVIDGNGTHIISQYTGLKDKNGKEIYEGDIVKYNAPQEVGKVVEVLFPDDYNWLKECCGGLKIIGNIYENKNLIK